MASLRYWFVGPLEALVDALPGFMARPLTLVIGFVYFNHEGLFFLFLPVTLASALVPVLIFTLTPAKSIPAVLTLSLLVVVVWRQWFKLEVLRDKLRTMEDELEENMVYKIATATSLKTERGRGSGACYRKPQR